MKWETLGGQISLKGKEVRYHVQCKQCKTVRILSKSELETEKCNCSRSDKNCKKEESKA